MGGATFDFLEKHYQLVLTLFPTFVVCIGAAKSLGYVSALGRFTLSRKALGLPTPSLALSGGKPRLGYASFFEGGLLGLRAAVILTSYVILMLLFFYLTEGKRPVAMVLAGVPTLMWYPVTMFCFLIAMQTINIRDKQPVSSSIFVIAATTIILALDVINTNESFLLTIQVSSVFLFCAIYSYLAGVAEGAVAADPAKSFPLVRVEVVHGTDLARAWLYETTPTDYRVLTEDGLNHIVPATNVKAIVAL